MGLFLGHLKTLQLKDLLSLANAFSGALAIVLAMGAAPYLGALFIGLGIVFVLAEHANTPSIDVLRVLKMLLIHDIVEIDAGDTFIHDEAGHIQGVVLVFRDETERRRMEDELQHARRMDSIGHLAGGVAHDFRNMLAGIGPFAIERGLVPAEEGETR